MDRVIKEDLVLILTGAFIVIALLLTSFLVLSDLAIVTGQDLRPQNSPENMVEALEYYINNENRAGMDRIFSDDEYSGAFEEIFFGEQVDIYFGFSELDRIRSKNQLSTHDLPSVKKGQLKNLTDEAGLTYLIIEVERKDDKNTVLAPATILQKSDQGWVINEIYDFMYMDSEFAEIDDFRVNYLDESVHLSIKDKYMDGLRESTRLYNFAQIVENITISYDDKVLCNIDKSNISGLGEGSTNEITSDTVYNPERITVEGECGLGHIVAEDRNQKYLLKIMMNTKDHINQTTEILYYGNMIA
ncbi:MAG: hypothetical protein ACLFSL_03225 [Candidatus Woesearchaeota archaeon]